MGIERVCTYQLKNNKVTFTPKTKHNTSREKPAETQMFKGTRNLESQSSGGESGPTEREGCALPGNAKANTQGDFCPDVPWPPRADRATSVVLPTRSRVMPDHNAEGTAGWSIPMLEPGSSLLSPEDFWCYTPPFQLSIFTQVSSHLPITAMPHSD